MQAELKVLDGKQQGKSIPLNMKKFLIGREEDCHLRASSDLISRHHCVFSMDDYTVRLRDLGSTNGTFVNGERISGQVLLNDGDRVQIGKLLFQVVIRQGAAAPRPAPAEALVSTVGEPGPINLSDSAILPSSQTQEITIPPEIAAQTQTGVFGGDTKVIGTPQPGIPETPAPMAPAAGYPMQPGYPMPVTYMPPAYPGAGFPPGYAMPGYPQAPYPVAPYPVAPYPMPGYGAPGMPGTGPQAPATPELSAVTLPPPEQTGAKPVTPPPAAEQSDPSQPEQKKPSQLAADIIRQTLQRRPT